MPSFLINKLLKITKQMLGAIDKKKRAAKEKFTLTNYLSQVL